MLNQRATPLILHDSGKQHAKCVTYVRFKKICLLIFYHVTETVTEIFAERDFFVISDV